LSTKAAAAGRWSRREHLSLSLFAPWPACRPIIGDLVTDKVLYMASAALATLSLFAFVARRQL
jgi:hypothetical protein